MNNKVKIFLTLPVLNEFENLAMLVECLRLQDYQSFELIVCVNQYDSWWENKSKIEICENNQRSLNYFKNITDFKVHLIDKSSKGKGWPDKKGGVGWARKIAMDAASGMADKNDLIVSIDADTYYPEDYLSGILDSFENEDKAMGIALPYYHQLTGNEENDRLILRYEIYMRYFLINLLRINNPYAITAIGSALACKIWAYRKVDGLTPVIAGEDFYFLQKLLKSGKVLSWSKAIAYPSSRYSDRVIFGTGPALIKGRKGNWASYPIYKASSFDKVKSTFDLFSSLYNKNFQTPMDEFLINQFKTTEIWEPLRMNYKSVENFERACINKIDGLRILQFLRSEQENASKTENENNLAELLKSDDFSSFSKIEKDKIKSINFDTSLVIDLEEIRNLLFQYEMKQRFDNYFHSNKI